MLRFHSKLKMASTKVYGLWLRILRYRMLGPSSRLIFCLHQESSLVMSKQEHPLQTRACPVRSP